MEQVIDSSVWIDYLRSRTPDPIRRIANLAISDPQACLCEPVILELRQGASKKERLLLQQQLSTLPLLSTPSTIWREAGNLAESALDAGLTFPSQDLLIAAICIHHSVALTSFDSHFGQLAKIAPLKLNLLSRPTTN